ncbi:hypothetical protein [Streptococcus sanguinis]|uniref:hypothetical protein n=1 Tax=Streptococcus sanguinis TaxID=1305 RepID=UPI0039C39607
MDKFFKLTEKGTDVRTEVLADLTTFFAMSYILFWLQASFSLREKQENHQLSWWLPRL